MSNLQNYLTPEQEALARKELRHLRQETARQQKTIVVLRQRLAEFEQQIRRLKKANRLLEKKSQSDGIAFKKQVAQLEDLTLIVAELRTMIFGKKRKKKPDETNDGENGTKGNKLETTSEVGNDFGSDAEVEVNEQGTKRKPANRAAASYRRRQPEESEVTQTYEHLISHCQSCGGVLTELRTIIRYTEDLPELTELSKILRRVEKHLIGTGYCASCHQRRSALPISAQVCSFGKHLKQFVTYSIIILQHSYQRIRDFLQDVAGIKVSDGEISRILTEQAQALKPERDRVLQRIRGEPGRHYDETGWPTRGGQGDYAWVSTGTEGDEAVFLLGRSRGHANAKELRGVSDSQVGISDGYRVYDNLFKLHQRCWAHPHRKLRDLREVKGLSTQTHALCVKSYEAFRGVYQELEEVLSSPYDKDTWSRRREELKGKLEVVAQIEAKDPTKLRNIKKDLQQNLDKYFTCLEYLGIPADNNKAERSLRHLVTKRKISFGSKSQKGADNLGILFSTLLSKWWSKPDNFFLAYSQMLAGV